MLVGGIATASGQSITPEVGATSGAHYQNGTSQLSWTLGEIAIETYSSTGIMITQGFHQPEITVTGIEEANPLQMEISVYPNPTSSFLNISAEGKHEQLSAMLYDMHGKLIMRSQLEVDKPRIEFDLTHLPMAHYVLRVESTKGNYGSTYKVIKSHN